MPNKALDKLLFVDDDEDILTIARLSLKSLNRVETRFLNSGDKVLETALSFQPDMIVLDIMMPGIDGLMVLKALKNHDLLKTIPVIFMTARVLQSEIEEYQKLGVTGVIVKPFDPISLPKQLVQYWESIVDST